MTGEIDFDFLLALFEQAETLYSRADADKLYDVVRMSAPLMRSLVKNRVFNGTISAGGGSCQITMKDNGRPPVASRNTSKMRRTSESHSLPMGNKTPLSAEHKEDTTLFPTSSRVNPEMMGKWRDRINDCFTALRTSGEFPEKMDKGLRGLYIGISAVFYAAKSAGCAEVILQKASFLQCLEKKLEELMVKPPKPKTVGDREVHDHREIANLTLVHTVVDRVLHDSAWIVCKRNWKAQPTMDMDEETEELATSARSATQKASPRRGSKEASPARRGSKEAGERRLSSSLDITRLVKIDKLLPRYVAGWVLGFYIAQTEQ